jgi:hypothetical protein
MIMNGMKWDVCWGDCGKPKETSDTITGILAKTQNYPKDISQEVMVSQNCALAKEEQNEV